MTTLPSGHDFWFFIDMCPSIFCAIDRRYVTAVCLPFSPSPTIRAFLHRQHFRQSLFDYGRQLVFVLPFVRMIPNSIVYIRRPCLTYTTTTQGGPTKLLSSTANTMNNITDAPTLCSTITLGHDLRKERHPDHFSLPDTASFHA